MMSIYKPMIKKWTDTFQSQEKLAAFYGKSKYEDWMFDAFLKGICTSSVLSGAFMHMYKQLDPIETLEPDQKTRMKKYAHDLFPGQPVEFKLRAVKVIYTFENYLSE